MTKRAFLKAVPIGVVFMLLLSVQPAKAAGALDVLRSTVEEIITVLTDPALEGEAKLEERREKIRASIKDIFNFKEMAKRSLGKHWKTLSDEEKAEFTGIFATLIENSYMRKIEMFTNEKILYEQGKEVKNTSIVRTKIIRESGTEIPVDYKLIDRGHGWTVYDVVVEGVSLVRNYRTQFGQIMKSKSYKDLVEQLKQKNKTA